MAQLEVEALRVAFYERGRQKIVIPGMDFHLQHGETLGLLGESGSGKSVACLAMLGLLPPQGRVCGGSVRFESSDLLSCPPREMRRLRGRHISMIFQDPGSSLNPYLRIGTQLTEMLDESRQRSRRRAIQALEEVGIPDPERSLYRYPHQFSGGQQQRIMIAMSLICNPEILIADEPTTALDATVQLQILELLERLRLEHSLSMIFISHDLRVIARTASRVLVLSDGKIIEQGTPAELFHSPQHPYTRSLIQAIPDGAGTQRSTDRKNQPCLLRAEKVQFTFRQRKRSVLAVDNVSLELSQGEIFGLVGESGSGKSTLSRALACLLQIENGKIFFDEHALHTLRGSMLRRLRSKIQMVFQNPYASLNPRMTVRDALSEPLLFHRLCSAEELPQKITELLAEVQLPADAASRYPHQFSGGQRQRIAIARALATRPQLLIADEPISSLDVCLQAQILELLLALNSRRNITLLFISHDLAVVRQICDRIAVMHRGRIVEQGWTEDVFANPQNKFTAQLIEAILPVPDRKPELKTADSSR